MNTYYRKSFDIAAYTYRAEILCPACTIAALPTGEGEAFDGWGDATNRMTAEDNLTEIATAFGIDRMDEYSFDSDEFPKVVFDNQLSEGDTCDQCGGEL